MSNWRVENPHEWHIWANFFLLPSLYLQKGFSTWRYWHFGMVILCWELSVSSLYSYSFKLWNYKLRQLHTSVYQYLLRWSIKILIWMKSACLKLKQYVCVLDAHSCPTLYHSMNCNPPGSSVHGVLQARILEWEAVPFSRGSSRPRDWTWVIRIAGRFFTVCATRETKSIIDS